MVADDDPDTDAPRPARSPFKTGTLWQRIVEVSDRALQSGHLLPIATRPQILADGEAVFRVHIVENVQRKLVANQTAGRSANPFLPYDSEMYVGDVRPHHVALLNKFNVVDHHLLIVTRDFEPQEDRLKRADFLALWSCLLEFDSLGFYNSGVEAGASQPHKHLQLVPLSDETAVTLEPLYDLDAARPRQIGRSTRLPFEHRLVRFVEAEMMDVERAARSSTEWYDRIIDELGWRGVGDDTPYNLLMTRRWMLFVPRRQECFESVSLNAMAFAGSLLAKDVGQLEMLRARGPMKGLVEVSAPCRIR